MKKGNIPVINKILSTSENFEIFFKKLTELPINLKSYKLLTFEMDLRKFIFISTPDDPDAIISDYLKTDPELAGKIKKFILDYNSGKK